MVGKFFFTRSLPLSDTSKIISLKGNARGEENTSHVGEYNLSNF